MFTKFVDDLANNLSEDSFEFSGTTRTLRLRTCHGTYIHSNASGHMRHSTLKDSSEFTWEEGSVSKGRKAFRNVSNQRFLCVERDSKVVCDRPKPQDFESFLVEIGGDNDTSRNSIVAHNSRFLCAHPSGTIVVNRYGPQNWESFHLEVGPFSPFLFGGSLKDMMAHQKKLGKSQNEIPDIIFSLAGAIRSLGGHSSTGIFRLSADSNRVASCKAVLNSGRLIDEYEDVNLPAHLLKAFLRELKEPVVPFDVYALIIKAGEGMLWERASELIRTMDSVHATVLIFIIKFLQSFLLPAYSAVTLMNSNNLSLMFAHNLLRCPSNTSPAEMLTNTKLESSFVKLLLENV
eukprot:TRINITY_DN1014_c0_g1_i1.p1 TRINITY_DN1014_c0_g1~~TRINITY_DN1014_c0_g1_i1.p1  ORF type:complete len:347 (-),score=70.45 TRINITY_DN1014_c0_g1_i1:202-1242(-)